MKIDKNVRKETIYVAIGTYGLSGVMLLVYLLISKFTFHVLWGALYGSTAAVLNFFFMAYSLQKAMETEVEENENKEQKVKLRVKSAYATRSLVLLISLIVPLVVGFVDIIALLIPLLFPQLTASIRMMWLKIHGEK